MSSNSIRAGGAFVEIFAEDKALVRGLKSASNRIKRWADSARDRMKKFGSDMMSLGKVGFMTGSAVLGPMVLASKQFADYGDALDEMSQRTGMSVEALAELGHAAELGGADLGTLEKAIRKQQQLLGEAAGGSVGAADKLKQLGLSFADLKDKSTEEQFMTLCEQLRKIPNEGQRAAMTMQIFGRNSLMLIPLIDAGAESIGEMREEARRLGISMSGQDATAAAEFSDALERLQKLFKGMVVQIGAALAPELTLLGNWFVKTSSFVIDFIQRNRKLIATMAKIAAVIVAAGAGLIALGGTVIGLGLLIMALGAIGSTAFSLLAGAVSFLISPIGRIIRTIAGMAWSFQHMSVIGSKAIQWLQTCFVSLHGVASKMWQNTQGVMNAILTPIGRAIFSLRTMAGACLLVVWNALDIGKIFKGVFAMAVKAINHGATSVYQFLNSWTEFKILFGLAWAVNRVFKLFGKTVLWAANSIIRPCFSFIFSVFGRLVNIATFVTKTVMSVFVDGFRFLLDIVTIAFRGIASVVASIVRKIISVIGSAFSKMVSLMGRALAPIFNVITTVFQKIRAFVFNVAEVIYRGVMTFLAPIGNALRIMAGWVVSFARSFLIVESAIQVFSLISSAIRNTIKLFSILVNTAIKTVFSLIKALPGIFVDTVKFLFALPGKILSVFMAIPRIVNGVFSTTLGFVQRVFSGVVAFASNIWSGFVSVCSSVFNKIGSIVSGFGNVLQASFASMGVGVVGLQDRFASLLGTASQTWQGIQDALAAGRLDLVFKVAWAGIRVVWTQGVNFLYEKWLWISGIIQEVWAATVYKISELFVKSWYGSQAVWTEMVFGMQATWLVFTKNFMDAWSTASTYVAKGLAWIYAKLAGFDAAEMVRIVEEDAQTHSRQRQHEYENAMAQASQQRDQGMASIDSDRNGTLNALKDDAQRKKAARKTAHDAEIERMEADQTKAQQELDAAVGEAANVRAAIEPDEKMETQAKKGWAVAAKESKAGKSGKGSGGKAGTFSAFEMGAIQGNTMEDTLKSSLRQHTESVTQLKKVNANLENGLPTFE